MNWWKLGAISGAAAVALGAFGAHGLKSVVPDPHWLEVWNTGARYHLVHSVVLLGLGLHPHPPQRAGWLFTAGVLLFSGSLYLLAITQVGILGAITPLGGLCFIAGWLSLALHPPSRRDE